jgi:hypothetical protein
MGADGADQRSSFNGKTDGLPIQLNFECSFCSAGIIRILAFTAGGKNKQQAKYREK